MAGGAKRCKHVNCKCTFVYQVDRKTVYIARESVNSDPIVPVLSKSHGRVTG